MRSLILLLCIIASAGCGKPFNESEMMKQIAPEIVLLNPTNTRNMGATGFEVVSPSGKVFTITNQHVCKMPGTENGLLAARRDGDVTSYTIRILEISEYDDLCIAEAIPAAKGLPVAEKLDLFRAAHVFGHPKLMPLTPAAGLILNRESIPVVDAETPIDKCNGPGESVHSINTFFGSLELCIMERDSFRTTIQIFGGNSGSPVMNEDGEVQGVVFAADSETHMGYIVPLDKLITFLKRY